MPRPVVDVFGDGTIRLGPGTVCDGYAPGYPFRVQTHVHDDHMVEFDKSKGEQDLFMSSETRALLIAERNEDLEFRGQHLGWKSSDFPSGCMHPATSPPVHRSPSILCQ